LTLFFTEGRDEQLIKEAETMAERIERPELILVGEDGNAFAILGRARRAAREAGWSTEEWEAVFAEATSGDYGHLLATMTEHFEVM
jgi:hypothetical protein